MTYKKWLLYGAYGYTGKLLLEEALTQNLTPIIGGRNLDKIKTLAEKYNLEYRHFSLDDPTQLSSGLKDIDLVLNAAGPFSRTADPMINVALKNGVHYLDITGEISVFENNYKYAEEALKKHVAIISGVGFDVVPSDCLAVYVSNKIENSSSLELVIKSMTESSPGTLKTVIQTLSKYSLIRKNGKLEKIKLGTHCKKFQLGKTSRNYCPIPWGDVSTAYRSTNIPNIKVFMPLSKNVRRSFRLFGALIIFVLNMRLVKKIVNKRIENKITGPDKNLRETSKSYLYCKVENNQKEIQEAWLITIESYKLTAITGVMAVKKLMDNSNTIFGVLTPAQAFGSEFILEVPDTHIYDNYADFKRDI